MLKTMGGKQNQPAIVLDSENIQRTWREETRITPGHCYYFVWIGIFVNRAGAGSGVGDGG